jgi:uncharacterized protein
MSDPKRVAELVETLGMQAHPERGWFAETYRSPLILTGLPHGANRNASTAIYFLLSATQPRTYLHRLKSDEIFHLYEGGPMNVPLLHADGRFTLPRLGTDIAAGERPQVVIPAGTWFAAELTGGAAHCLFGCTVAPGFDFADFELGGDELAREFPDAASVIGRFGRPPRG